MAPSKFRITDDANVILGHAAVDLRSNKGAVLDNAIINCDITVLANTLVQRYMRGLPQSKLIPTSFNLSQEAIDKLNELSEKTHLSANYLVCLIAESVSPK